ncbi:hypothetical protein [Actinotignum schaalii]|uniref:hypothetical protein n=1 Tax=Actinotignum schaalii TaxID=59505 RepID=UPI0012DCB49A|nr:hypothetical protein [Actinotignum schaalii]
MAASTSGGSSTPPVVALAHYVREHGDQEILFGEKDQFGHGLGVEDSVWELCSILSAAKVSGSPIPETMLVAAINDITYQLDAHSSGALNAALEHYGSSLRVPQIPRDE